MKETTLDEDAVPSEQDLCDLSQLINSTYLSMSWAHRGTGVHSEGLH